MTAWAASYLLSGQPLPAEFGRVGVPISIGAETAFEVDDVAVTTDDSVLLIQAKGGLTLRKEPTADIAKAIGQVVRQFIAGVPSGTGTRPLDPERDILAIVGDENTSQPARAMTVVCDRLRSLPANVLIDSTARTAVEKRALNCLMSNIKHAWREVTGREPLDFEIRGVTSVLSIRALDLVSGEALAAVKRTLEGSLLKATDVDRAWAELCQIGLELATEQRWLDRNGLVRSLTVDVGPERRLAADIRQLRESTRTTLTAISRHATLRLAEKEISVRRQQVDLLLADDANCVLVGVPGSGKSGVLASLADELGRSGQDVIVLAIDQLGLSAGSARTELGLNFDLSAVIRGWTGAGSGTLILDGLDAVRSEASAWLRELCLSLEDTRWRVVASIREFDLRHSREWQKVFPGSPLADENLDQTLASVRHMRMNPFSDQELSNLSEQSADVSTLLRNSSEGLLELLRVPFNLSIAADLLSSGQSQESLSALASEVELLDRYWHARIADVADGIGRRQVVRRVTRTMLESRRLSVDSDALADAPSAPYLALLRDGVLAESSGILRSGGRARVGFSHHTLFDFAVATLVFVEDDRSRLKAELDLDPNLVFLARPSIDFHLADLWRATSDHNLFFEEVFKIAESDHVLAGIAAGSTFLSGLDDHPDTQDLFSRLELMADRERVATVIAWIVGAMEAAGGIEIEIERIRSRLSVWAAFAGRLSTMLSTEYNRALAYQVSRLHLQLDTVVELGQGPDDAEEVRASAVLGLLSLALAEPEARGWLIVNLARLLPKALAVQPASSGTVRELASPALLEILPSRVYWALVDEIAILAQADPEAATDLLVGIWEYSPDSDEVTTLSAGVVGLTSTRRQDANHVKWQIGEEFADFAIAAGVERASRVLVAVSGSAEGYSSRFSYGITFGDALGTVQQAFGTLRHEPGMGAGQKILDSLVAALADAPSDDVRASLTVLTRSVSHPAIWRSILSAAAQHPSDLGRIVLPVLEAGGLLANPDTRRSAVGLAVACAACSSDAWVELERALLRAIDIVSENRHVSDVLCDEVLAVFPPEMLSDPQLKLRRAALSSIDVSAIPEPSEFEEAEWEDRTGIDESDLTGLDSKRQKLGRLLISALETFRSTDSPDAGPLYDALKSNLEAAEYLPDEPSALVSAVVDACDALVGKSALSPDDPVAIRALELILAVSSDEKGALA
ncbi:hypothetical protein [Isoptericola sp. NPDC058082]|uniref:hypothetical protein n=1 Tax=Isoptericola sp. NPDC058082 TaxID=3346331 RepID=UPI0036EDF84E